MEGPELPRIDRARTAKAAWDALKAEFDGQLAHQQHIADAGDLRQKQGETAEAYGDRALDLFYQLEDSGFQSANTLVTQFFIKGVRPGLHASCLAPLMNEAGAGVAAVARKIRELTRLLPADSKPGKALHVGGNKGFRKETHKCFNCDDVGRSPFEGLSPPGQATRPENRSGPQRLRRDDSCGSACGAELHARRTTCR
jgi:hypothetical protein